jgi:radical SAM superfamily enzyme YgiQ (UPF0313 family)
MELPSRPKNDRYTRPGQYLELERRLRANPHCAEIPALVAYAFDWRTRMGPFLFVDKVTLTAGPRAIAAALYNAGFTRQRLIQRQWNRYLQPSEARFDGQPPQMLCVSSMQIHSASAYELIADAYRLGEERPFILAGGAKAIYEPGEFFGFEYQGRTYSADVVVTGEEYVLLELLDRIMEARGSGEHPRRVFHRLRRSGLLDDILGLVFREGSEKAPLTRLINTGPQRLVQDLDELPHPIVAMNLIEPPHRRRTMSAQPVPLHRLRRYAEVVAVVPTHGCKFHCPYCPIPAYNQFTLRHKSPERLRDEMEMLANQTGIEFYFGTDDNFFYDRRNVEATFTELAKGKFHGKPFRDSLIFATEGTEHDVYKSLDLLPIGREGGLRAIWFGIEDMTAELIKKGQSPEKTAALFKTLRDLGIAPMPMMMHHDGQPLRSRGNLYGLLNQVHFLQRHGALSVQVTMLTPSVGSKGYEEPYEQGLVIEQAGKMKTEDYLYDGNHAIATSDPHPWRTQMNIFRAYAGFYNPLNLLHNLGQRKDPLYLFGVQWQLLGMIGLARSFLTSAGWLWNLYRGPIKRTTQAPRCRLPMVPPPVSPAQVDPALHTQTV